MSLIGWKPSSSYVLILREGEETRALETKRPSGEARQQMTRHKVAPSQLQVSSRSRSAEHGWEKSFSLPQVPGNRPEFRANFQELRGRYERMRSLARRALNATALTAGALKSGMPCY